MKNETKLRNTFDQEAKLYNEVRPNYPDVLFEKLIEVAALSQKSRLIEIGLGTGQATKPLAKRGYDIVAIELGSSLADVARRELHGYPNVKIVTGAFEDIRLSDETFDLVFAATALHWIKSEARFSKPHRILKPEGNLAIIHTNHVSDEKGDTFFEATQPIYDRYFASDKNNKPILPPPDSIEPTEFDEKLFQLAHFQRFPKVITYNASKYAKLLNTYSPNLSLSEKERIAFLNDIETLISEKFNGRVEKHFIMSLTIAKKK